ncbi:MAG: cytochrome C biogenesis protein [Bacteroidetes bacterium]|nr:cytochrome C biogenesis protein [Bacteroidota bacterium]MCW5896203.1 cytochrome C biogenesis protein [Bacteroidota bacterium]
MLDELFIWLSTAIGGTFGVALLAAFGWGVISIILSPCHLSSIPLVVGYISSQGKDGIRRAYSIAFVFAIGILITIGLIGAITASAGRMMGDVGVWGNVLVAGVFFVVGLYLMDVISVSWNGFMPQTSFARGWKRALLLGLIFGIGLGPCTFAYMAPVLGVAFSVATTNMLEALSLITAFGIGHCAVIVAAGGTAGTVQKYLNWTERSKGATWLKRSAGVLVMLGGVYYISTAF